MSASDVRPKALADLLSDMAVFDMGLSFALCHRDSMQQREAIKKLQHDFTELMNKAAALPFKVTP